MSLFLFLLLADEDIAVEEAAVDDAADDDSAVDAADEDAAVDAADDDGAFDELDDLICLTLAERVCLREAEVDDDAELFA